MTVQARPGRAGRQWSAAVARLKASATVCAICGGDLVPDAPPRSRWSTAVDHIVPLSDLRMMFTGAELEARAADPINLRVTHYGCNSRRGAGRAQPSRQSRRW